MTEVPTITKIKEHFNVEGLPNTALFWSSCGTGVGDTWKDLSNAYANSVHRLTLDLMWKDAWYEQFIRANSTDGDVREFWNRASEAMADISSGVVYVLLPPTGGPRTWSECSTWNLVEYPVLITKGNVNKICRVNYNSNTEEYSDPFAVWPNIDEHEC